MSMRLSRYIPAPPRGNRGYGSNRGMDGQVLEQIMAHVTETPRSAEELAKLHGEISHGRASLLLTMAVNMGAVRATYRRRPKLAPLTLYSLPGERG